MQLAKFYVSTYKALRYIQPPRFWSEQIEAHALIHYEEFSEFLTSPVDQYLSVMLTIAPSNLNYWWQLHWAWLSTSVCQILFCPFMIVPIFCHLNAKSKVSSVCMIEVIQLTHCLIARLLTNCFDLISSNFLRVLPFLDTFPSVTLISSWFLWMFLYFSVCQLS